MGSPEHAGQAPEPLKKPSEIVVYHGAAWRLRPDMTDLGWPHISVATLRKSFIA
jgi:hypothetical protein